MQRFASHRCLSSLRKFLGLAAVVSLACVFTTPAMGGRHPATLLPLEAARMDEYLSPERMMGEVELSTADGQRLLEQLPVREVYSSDGGGATLEQTPIRLSPMTVRTFKKRETPDAPDLTAVMDGDTPRVEVASASGPIRWMGSNDTAISSIQVLGHDLFGASPATTEAFAEWWQRAATHPVVVVTTEDEVLFAHNGVTVLSQTRTTTASGHRDIQNQYGFRTVLYSITPADFTTDSLDGYWVVLDTEETGNPPRGPAHLQQGCSNLQQLGFVKVPCKDRSLRPPRIPTLEERSCLACARPPPNDAPPAFNRRPACTTNQRRSGRPATRWHGSVAGSLQATRPA